MPAPHAINVTQLKGVGTQLSQKLSKLNIESIQDLIFHLPYKYQDRTHLTVLGQLTPGMETLFSGQIETASLGYGRRRSLVARIADGTGWLTLRWFYFNRHQQQQFKPGRWLSGFGTVRHGSKSLEMIHPEYRISSHQPEIQGAKHLTPMYPLTEGISQAKMRHLVKQSLDYAHGLHDYLNAKPGLHECLERIHFPLAGESASRLIERTDPAQKRLALEELTAHHISLKRYKLKRRSKRSPALNKGHSCAQQLLEILPFTLTSAQQRVMAEIEADLNRPFTMQRLVQGDVGSGKTVLAAYAICQCVGAGHQGVIMAPTELLAEQHLDTLKQWLEPLGITLAWLSGRLPAAERRQALKAIGSGAADVAIGTHALFQSAVEFKRLGLVVVDEQHRFGVNQRLALIDKAAHESIPHQLAMTATPIPRTMAMIFYADLDVSSIDELPAGRKPVDTVLVSDARRDEVIQRILSACQQGRQAYWVCPLIEESEIIQAEAATKRYQALVKSLPALRVALIHGRMKSDEKNNIMQAFRDHDIDVLVATTVIEVGVDVANASLMIIENAERLGLSQLHQLRGRIGRGEIQSCCVLMYHSPIGEMAQKRLTVMRNYNDGFEISKYDLKLRGPGELLGTRQTGLPQLKVADLVRDQDLLDKVEKLGEELFKQDPAITQALIDRWVKNAGRYADV